MTSTMKKERLSVLIEKGVELSNWELERAQMAMNVAEAISVFHPCEVVANVDDSTENVDANHVRPMLVHELDIMIREEDGMLTFVPEKRYPLVGNNQTPELIKPCRIGLTAITERKVRQWLDYIEQRDVILSERQGATEAKHAAFLDKLERSGELVERYPNDRNKGCVVKGNLRFEFELYPGGVSTDIKLGNTDRTFETWQRMTRFATDSEKKPVKRLEEFVI